ncbi:MAG: multicopper oxidase domain-containing protein [Methylococcales bacterium]
MKKIMSHERRDFLQLGVMGAVGATVFPTMLLGETQTLSRSPNKLSPSFKPDVEIELAAETAFIPIIPGRRTKVWRYFGKVIKGHKDSVVNLKGTYLGPIFNFEQGQKVRIHFINKLPAPCITHWHGLHVPSAMDGHPMYAIQSGETYVYEYEILNPAGTSWFHPHTHSVTGKQAYSGLAGLIRIFDKEEEKLDLPRDEFDIPLIIQDRTFNEKNQLQYLTHPKQAMIGFLGEKILVNGKPNFILEVATRVYRLRFLNGSNSRIYKLAWDDGTPIDIIGTDGGLLEKPERLPYLMLGPAERADVWMDFSGRKKGSELVMKSLDFSGTMPPMYERMKSMHRSDDSESMRKKGMGGMRGKLRGMMDKMRDSEGLGMMAMTMGIPQGVEFPVFKIRVTRKEREDLVLPKKLVNVRRLLVKDAINQRNPVPIGISMKGMKFVLNGEPFKMTGAKDFETIKLNSVQLLEIFHDHEMKMEDGETMEDMEKENNDDMSQKVSEMNTGGMGGDMMAMSMAHPIHLHGQQFQIIKRHPPKQSDGYDSVKDGFLKTGLKDTVVIMPGEKITIIKPFEDFKGLFLYHCHNLEHEDMDMMRNFLVI